jgi:hypothetical protein
MELHYGTRFTLYIQTKPNDMKLFYGTIFMMIALFYSSCAVVESIFKAGVWVGVLIVVAIIGLIVWLISKFSRRG